jgi:hypothetical protein
MLKKLILREFLSIGRIRPIGKRDAGAHTVPTAR